MSEKMREALIVYIAAGVGNSTDYEKQADARRLAMEALAEQPDQEKYSTFANVEYSVETHTASKQPAQGEEWRHVIVDVMADISDHSSLAYEKLRALLQATPPAPSVPDDVFCRYCGGNDETPPDHCMDCQMPPPPAWREIVKRLISAKGAAADAAIRDARAMLAVAPEVPS